MVPAPDDSRLIALDVIRGVAVIGILVMNIVGFALPLAAYSNPAALGPPSDPDLVAWALGALLVDGKMRALFTLLFGASALLVMERAAAAGRKAWAVNTARLGWLLAFGIVHFYAIWSGDILIEYAAVGLVLPLFRPLPPALLAMLGGGLTLLLVATSLGALGHPPDAAFLAANFGRDPAEVAADLALYGGASYAQLVAHRTTVEALWPWWSLRDNGLESLALMLLGMAALKAGMAAADYPARRLARWAGGSLALGLAGQALLVAWQWRSGFDAWTVYRAVVLLAPPFNLAIALGYAALLALAARRGGALVARLAAAGRMAFTNYLATSLVMTSLFYGYGAGLFGTVGRAGLLLFVAAMAAAMLGWSRPWLERFAYGPFEWLWRSLARGRLQRWRA